MSAETMKVRVRDRSAELPWGSGPVNPVVRTVEISIHGQHDPDAERGWRSLWMLHGQRVLKSGAISDKRPVSMWRADFPPGQVPTWIMDAVERHHPEGGPS